MNEIPQNKKHLLTVLVEDYFHVGAFENLIRQRNWTNFEPRFEQNTLKTLDLLDEFKVKATFFVLGWIAEQNPRIVREIVNRGHEVASRGFYHRSLSQLTPEEFREDVRKTNRVLEDAAGQKIIGYRAAEKLVYEKDAWILDVLAEEDFVYDASFLPTQKDAKEKRFAHQVHAGGKIIQEFPYATRNVGVGLLPISGGNYFRQIPHTLMRHAVEDWHRRYDAPFVLYFHVWELDPEQPRISAATRYNRVRHYRKLDKMEWVIKEYLRKYDFTTGADFLGLKDELQITNYALRNVEPILEITNRQSQTANPVSIVIPCYNEEAALPYLANTLKSVETNLRENYEPHFIFVDDASKDNTFDKLQELFGGKENVKIIRHEKNQGVAAGIMSGIKAAETETVCSMDCDCTYDPHEIERMIPLLTDGVDLVTASPYHKSGGVRNVPEWRLFLSKGASFLYRRVLNAKLDTYTSCFRVYRRSAIVNLDLQETGFLGVAELLGKLDLRGGKIFQHPAILEVRLFGFSKMKTARTIFGHLRLLTRLSKERFFGKNKLIKTSLPKDTLKVISKRGNQSRIKFKLYINQIMAPIAQPEIIKLPNDQDASGRTFSAEEIAAVTEVLTSGVLITTKGKYGKMLEKEFAEKLGVKYAYACNSGSAAVHVAVAAINPNPGDEIITTSITDMGALTPIIFQGAIPVFADVDPKTLNVTAETIERVLSDKTKAIIVTHLFGNPCEMKAIMKLADERGIPVIEDTAQSFMATCDGKYAGTIGAIGAFSFQQGKQMTTGEGGIVVTNDDALARRMYLFINKAWGYGDANPDHYFASLNYRMTELQAAVAYEQLKKLDYSVSQRQKMAKLLDEKIKDIDGIESYKPAGNSTMTYWKFCLRVDDKKIEDGAVGLAKALKTYDVASAPRYVVKPAYKCMVFRDQNTFGDSHYPFNLARPEAVDYNDDNFQGTIKGLHDVLVLPINERYEEKHIEFLADSIREAVEKVRK